MAGATGGVGQLITAKLIEVGATAWNTKILEAALQSFIPRAEYHIP